MTEKVVVDLLLEIDKGISEMEKNMRFMRELKALVFKVYPELKK